MIKHNYSVPSDNQAQWVADQIGRQEVSREWASTVAIDYDLQLWAWVSDECYDLSLDPWRMIDGPEDRPNARYFVQRDQLEQVPDNLKEF